MGGGGRGGRQRRERCFREGAFRAACLLASPLGDLYRYLDVNIRTVWLLMLVHKRSLYFRLEWRGRIGAMPSLNLSRKAQEIPACVKVDRTRHTNHEKGIL